MVSGASPTDCFAPEERAPGFLWKGGSVDVLEKRKIVATVGNQTTWMIVKLQHVARLKTGRNIETCTIKNTRRIALFSFFPCFKKKLCYQQSLLGTPLGHSRPEDGRGVSNCLSATRAWRLNLFDCSIATLPFDAIWSMTLTALLNKPHRKPTNQSAPLDIILSHRHPSLLLTVYFPNYP
jgi:hypothetical protein